MNLVGYTDRLSVAPGKTVRFMVSCDHSEYRADLVRLIHGDENPAGPGFKEREVASAINAEYQGRHQSIRSGSCVIIPDCPAFDELDSFTLTAWLYPTTPERGTQGLLTHWSPLTGEGFGLFIDEDGGLSIWLGNGRGRPERVSTAAPVRAHDWSFVACGYDSRQQRAFVYQSPVRPSPLAEERCFVERAVEQSPNSPRVPLIMAACFEGERSGRLLVGNHFNGKIDRPRLFNRALTPSELEALETGHSPLEFGDSLVGAWDFGVGFESDRVVDTSPNQLYGRAVNMPTRAVTGYNWSGSELDFKRAPAEYGAIYFHDDDLEDAAWEADFELTIPPVLESGVYAARLTAGDDEDYLPFFVRPPKGKSTARIAFLAPTIHYTVYSNFRDVMAGHWDPVRVPNANAGLHLEEHRYAVEKGLPGLYDLHSDGSGTTYVSRLRPTLNMRPKYRYRVWSAPARFPADLYLIDWLDARGFTVDVITDDDLHAEGANLLHPYRVVLTGSHHEYWTSQMLDAMRAYLDGGGRLMYMGGNGFFGVTSVDPERPHVHEVRRWGTSWPFEMPPGERHHSTTGEHGGTWRNRGRAPQQMLGVGTCAAGFDRGTHYVRQPGSFDPRADFIFDGIEADELIGDFPSLVVNHGPAGYEIDRLDYSLGTPRHALLLASSINHSIHYAAMHDEQLAFPRGIDGVKPGAPTEAGKLHPFVRADMVYFETKNGGAVFSVGSIAWMSCLSYNGYDNNVSRITENVLSRFASDD